MGVSGAFKAGVNGEEADLEVGEWMKVIWHKGELSIRPLLFSAVTDGCSGCLLPFKTAY